MKHLWDKILYIKVKLLEDTNSVGRDLLLFVSAEGTGAQARVQSMTAWTGHCIHRPMLKVLLANTNDRQMCRL